MACLSACTATVLAACAPPVQTAQRPAPAAEADPVAFVEHLYSAYTGGGTGVEVLGRDAASVFTPELVALLEEDRRRAGGELGLLDYDPLCSCQDFQRFELNTVQLRERSPTRADVAVSFVNADKPVTLRLLLERGPGSGEWRIADVATPEQSSLADYLREGLERSIK
jgi:hypothetical protein